MTANLSVEFVFSEFSEGTQTPDNSENLKHLKRRNDVIPYL